MAMVAVMAMMQCSAVRRVKQAWFVIEFMIFESVIQ